MCGRYVVTKADWGREFGAIKLPLNFEQSYNVAPGQKPPIVCRVDDKRVITSTQWGFRPQWVKDIDKWRHPINARAETLFTNGAFRQAIKRRRCLVPATGWYEWQAVGGSKQPCYLTSNEPITFGGVWDLWRQDGEELASFAIITVPAPKAIEHVHHRAPLVIDREYYDSWLDPEINEPERLSLETAEREWNVYPVSKRVNRPANDDSTLIEPIVIKATPQAAM